MLPHLKRVATLPCEISVQKILSSVPFMVISQYPVYWFKKLEKDLQGFVKLCEGFWVIELDLYQNEKKEFQY